MLADLAQYCSLVRCFPQYLNYVNHYILLFHKARTCKIKGTLVNYVIWLLVLDLLKENKIEKANY